MNQRSEARESQGLEPGLKVLRPKFSTSTPKALKPQQKVEMAITASVVLCMAHLFAQLLRFRLCALDEAFEGIDAEAV